MEHRAQHYKKNKGPIVRIIRVILAILYWLILAVMLFFGIVGRHLADWYKATFNTSFREVIYTFNLGIKGADLTFMKQAVEECRYELGVFAAVIAVIAIYEVTLFIVRRTAGRDAEGVSKDNLRAAVIISRVLIMAISLTLCIPVYKYTDKILKVSEFLKERFTYTKIYDDYYVSPHDVSITASADRRNVILIYLESMETTYASKKLGGFQDKNLIPELTWLAEENISFGDRPEGQLGGIHNPYGTTWTTAAIMASEAGVPFSFRIGKNKGGMVDSFAAHLPTLGEFLQEEGYRQIFLCGSDSAFGGKKAYFEQHGDYEIYDYFSAIEDGYIDEDYKVWWGLEDHRLYEIARDKLTEISKSDQPFNFTMLTVDTHHVGGYVCDWCPDTYENDTENVVACADRQISEFIDWCREQDFYKDTTIIIMGDHPRMDQKLVKKADYFEREAYDCFINPAIKGEVNETRTAATMDLFPTILAAMGYEIEGNRLGLGTNLFSDEKTLAEELTYEKLNDEVGRSSKFYLENFN